MRLLLCVVEVKELNNQELDPSEAAEFEARSLFGEACDTLIQPFINIIYSLTQQIASLIKFVPVRASCLWFVPQQQHILLIHGDVQEMAKNTIFIIAKT